MNENSTENDRHPGWRLSRDCIMDTYVAKRTGIFLCRGSLPAICAHTIRILRETQLAPHKEQKMIAGRYHRILHEKKTAQEIVVVLRGGIIQEVYSTNSLTRVYIADYDMQSPDDAELEALEDAEERVARGDMHVVY